MKLTDTAPLRRRKADFVEKVLDLTSQGEPNHTFKILKVEVEPDETAISNPADLFTTETADVEAGRHYKLHLRLVKLPREDVRSIKTTVLVTTDDPRVGTLKIPVRAQF